MAGPPPRYYGFEGISILRYLNISIFQDISKEQCSIFVKHSGNIFYLVKKKDNLNEETINGEKIK